MIFFYFVKSALHAILQAKLRSFLTILGIIIGVSSVVTIISLGSGLKNQINNQVKILGVNVLTVTLKPQGENFTINDVNSIQKLDFVSGVAPLMYDVGSTSAGSNNYDSLITATTPGLLNVINQPLQYGRFLKSSGNETVIGSSVGSALFGSENPVGENIIVKYAKYDPLTGQESESTMTLNVIGQFKKLSNNSSIGIASQIDGAIFIPLRPGAIVNGDRLQISTLLIKVKQQNKLNYDSSIISNLLKTNHHGQNGFTISTSQDIAASYSYTLNKVAEFIVGVAAVSLLVGGIGIMNIMLSNVSERTKEIGIRKAIGAKRSYIFYQFLIESLILTLIGGVVGVIASFGLSYLVFLNTQIEAQFTTNAFLIGLLSAFVIGLVFGVSPAFKAAQKRPIESLRHD